MFFISDALRRSLGSLFDGAGLAPQQASWRVVLDQIFACAGMADKVHPLALF